MDFIKLIGSLFGFNKQIYFDEKHGITYENLYSINQEKIRQLDILLDSEEKKVSQYQARTNQLVKEIEILNKQLNERPNVFYPDLPSPFSLGGKIYKSGWKIITNEKNKGYTEYERIAKIGGEHLTLTPMFEEVLTIANIKSNDNALSVFNKILGVVQTKTGYKYDQDQWGAGNKNHENWTPSNIVWTTKNDDCESVAGLTVSVFDYYKLKTGKFMDAYGFVGTGLFAQNFGHGFPCIYIPSEKNFEENLFIGEATLSSERNCKPLKDCKNTYWCNWGNHSFYHDFNIKTEFSWWDTKTAKQITDKLNKEGVGMTGNQVDDREEFEKKKKAIKDFWSDKK